MKTKLKSFGGLGITAAILCGAWVVAAQSQNQQAIDLFSLGLKEKDPHKKIATYTKAIELDPQFVEALYNIGLACMQVQDYARAEQFLQRAFTSRPERTKNEAKLKIVQELARVEGRLGKAKDQEVYVRQAKELATETAVQATIIWELGSLLHAQGRLEEAQLEFQAGQRLNSARTDEFASRAQQMQGEIDQQQLYAQAQKYAAGGNFEMAIAKYEALLQAAGEYKDARAKLQALRDQLEQKKVAEKIESEYELGRTALRAKDWTNAVLAFERVLELDPDFRDTQRRLREAQNGLEREGTASILARYYAEGVAAMNQNDLNRASAALEKVHKMNADYRNSAALLLEIKNKLAQQTHTPSPSTLAGGAVNLDSLYQAAAQAQDKEDWVQAMITLEKLQILQPNYRDTAERLARVRQHMQHRSVDAAAHETSGRWGAIAGVLATIVALPVLGFMVFSPGMRARYYVLRCDYLAAVQVYERLLTRHPQRTRIYPALANLYLLLGQKDERALKVFKTVLQLNLATPHRDHINAIVAEHFLTEGRTDSDAIAVLESALAVERRRLKA
ncbi:MAG: tetratricopeptide repeat protein [bacterium]